MENRSDIPTLILIVLATCGVFSAWQQGNRASDLEDRLKVVQAENVRLENQLNGFRDGVIYGK